MGETITYSVEDRVATITLNRPERLNAFLPGMEAAYADLLRRADADPEVRVVVVTGAGRGFCSGADLDVLEAGGETLQGFRHSPDSLPSIAFTLSVPVVAAINGPCAGIGFVLAMCSDVRFASPAARFLPVFPRLGLIAEYGIAWVLPRIVGHARATEMLLRGSAVDSAEAARIGLVHTVADDVLDAAYAWARDVAINCSPTSLAIIKRQLMEEPAMRLDEAVRESLALMGDSFDRPDLAIALQARAEKRPPAFPPRP